MIKSGQQFLMIFSHPGILLGSYTHTHTHRIDFYDYFMTQRLSQASSLSGSALTLLILITSSSFWSRASKASSQPPEHLVTVHHFLESGSQQPIRKLDMMPPGGHRGAHASTRGSAKSPQSQTYFKLLVKYLFQDVTTALSDLSFRPQLVSTLHELSSLARLFPLLPLFVQLLFLLHWMLVIQPSFFLITSPPLVL